MISFFKFFNRAGETFSHWFLLFVRLFWGLQLATAGWGKLQNLSATAGFFANLGIPFPELNAGLVGYTELVCGLLLAVGLITRLASVPVLIVLLVALFTAHVGFLADPLTVIKESPFTFIIAALTLFSFGAGKFSLDYLIEK